MSENLSWQPALAKTCHFGRLLGLFTDRACLVVFRPPKHSFCVDFSELFKNVIKHRKFRVYNHQKVDERQPKRSDPELISKSGYERLGCLSSTF